MRTTIDLPDALVERVKVSAARQKTTMRELVIAGLEALLDDACDEGEPAPALERLRQGYALGNNALSRDQAHAR